MSTLVALAAGPPHALYVCGFRSCSYKFISLHWTCACTSCLQVHLLALCLRMLSMYASSSPWTMPTHTVCATPWCKLMYPNREARSWRCRPQTDRSKKLLGDLYMAFAHKFFRGPNIFSVAWGCSQSQRVSQLKLENTAKTWSYTQFV